jgi:hypothetical protein
MRAYLDAMNAWILACAMRSNPLALACAIHLHALCAAAHVPCERASNILRIQHPSHNCPCAAGACAQRARTKHPRERAQSTARERAQSTRAHTGPVDGKKEKRELRQEAVDNSLNDWNCKWGEQDGEGHHGRLRPRSKRHARPGGLSQVQGQGGLERSKES